MAGGRQVFGRTLLFLLLCAAAGCGTDRRERLEPPKAETESSSSRSDAVAPPEPSQYVGRVFQGGALGGNWSVAEIRRGRHEGFLRFVIELESDGTPPPASGPRYEISEVYNAHPFPESEDGRAVIDGTWGDARIDIRLSDVRGGRFFAKNRVSLPWVIDESRIATKFGLLPLFDDAVLGFSIGLREATPYEVRYFPAPPRVIVDIAEPGAASP